MSTPSVRPSLPLAQLTGWLDDYILEALVFDGSETAGDKVAAVNFKLTGKF